MPKLRVLVVEDSLTVRRRLCDVLASDPDVEVVGEAEDGQRGVDLCRALRPDVVTLDMHLPQMTGVEATEHIMANFPTPILIVSSSTNRGELFKTYDALSAGAVDVLEKPTGNEPDGDWEGRFLSAVKLVARIKVITHPRARLRGYTRSSSSSLPASLASVAPGPAPAPAGAGPRAVVGLGASTGGPGALGEVLRTIPSPLACPAFFVLHIGDPFGAAFAEWLERLSGHRVAMARDGERVASLAGRVTMAPPGRHLVIERGVLRLTSDPERHACRPSVDTLFESLAREYGAAVVAGLLTGMGRDGASGLAAVRAAGGSTIAQDEATSVVYGMPREAVLMGAAGRVLPLAEIGPAVASLVRSRLGDAP